MTAHSHGSHPFAQNAKEWGTPGFVTDGKGGPPATQGRETFCTAVSWESP